MQQQPHTYTTRPRPQTPAPTSGLKVRTHLKAGTQLGKPKFGD